MKNVTHLLSTVMFSLRMTCGHVALVGQLVVHVYVGLHAVQLPGPELPAPELAPRLPQGGGVAPHAAALVADGITHVAGWLRAGLGITAIRNSEFINTPTATQPTPHTSFSRTTINEMKTG